MFFVVFFLSPKINNYLSENEINNSKVQFSKIVSIINSKSRTIEENDKLNLEEKKATVEVDSTVTDELLAKAVENAGYQVVEVK